MGVLIHAYRTDDNSEIFVNSDDLSAVMPEGVRYVSAAYVGLSSPYFTSIQSAIDASASGEVVVVYPGIYTERVTLKNGVDMHSVGNAVIMGDGGVGTAPLLRDPMGGATVRMTGTWQISWDDPGGASFAMSLGENDTNLFIEHLDISDTSGATAYIGGGKLVIGSANTLPDVNVVGGQATVNVQRVTRNLSISGGYAYLTIGEAACRLNLDGGRSYININRITLDNQIIRADGGFHWIRGLEWTGTHNGDAVYCPSEAKLYMTDCTLINESTSAGSRVIHLEYGTLGRFRANDCRFYGYGEEVVRYQSTEQALFDGCTIVNLASTGTPRRGFYLTTSAVSDKLAIRNTLIKVNTSGATKESVGAASAKNVIHQGNVQVSHAAGVNVTWRNSTPTTVTYMTEL